MIEKFQLRVEGSYTKAYFIDEIGRPGIDLLIDSTNGDFIIGTRSLIYKAHESIYAWHDENRQNITHPKLTNPMSVWSEQDALFIKNCIAMAEDWDKHSRKLVNSEEWRGLKLANDKYIVVHNSDRAYIEELINKAALYDAMIEGLDKVTQESWDDAIAEGHNPKKFTNKQVGKGYALLRTVNDAVKAPENTEFWSGIHKEWRHKRAGEYLFYGCCYRIPVTPDSQDKQIPHSKKFACYNDKGVEMTIEFDDGVISINDNSIGIADAKFLRDVLNQELD